MLTRSTILCKFFVWDLSIMRTYCCAVFWMLAFCKQCFYRHIISPSSDGLNMQAWPNICSELVGHCILPSSGSDTTGEERI